MSAFEGGRTNHHWLGRIHQSKMTLSISGEGFGEVVRVDNKIVSRNGCGSSKEHERRAKKGRRKTETDKDKTLEYTQVASLPRFL